MREERRKWGYAGVWEIAAMRRDKDSEPQIPVELPWRCLKMHSDLRGVVLDLFVDLGTTLIACEQSRRLCRAMESDPLHCDLIVRQNHLQGKYHLRAGMEENALRVLGGTRKHLSHRGA